MSCPIPMQHSLTVHLSTQMYGMISIVISPCANYSDSDFLVKVKNSDYIVHVNVVEKIRLDLGALKNVV